MAVSRLSCAGEPRRGIPMVPQVSQEVVVESISSSVHVLRKRMRLEQTLRGGSFGNLGQFSGWCLPQRALDLCWRPPYSPAFPRTSINLRLAGRFMRAWVLLVLILLVSG